MSVGRGGRGKRENDVKKNRKKLALKETGINSLVSNAQQREEKERRESKKKPKAEA